MVEAIGGLAWSSVATAGAWMSSQYDILEDRDLYGDEPWSVWDSTYSASLRSWLPERPSDNNNVFLQREAEANVECVECEGSEAMSGSVEPGEMSYGSLIRDLEYCCQMHHMRGNPVLWRMQESITHSGENALDHIGLQVPQTIKQPSAEALLVSWVAITLAAAAYCEGRSGHRYRRLVLLGSVLVAMTIGIAEGTSSRSVALTNMPWCLALGMMADCVVYNTVGAVYRHYAHSERSVEHSQCRKEEKLILA